MNADARTPSTEELYDGAPCGLLSTAANGTIERVNETFCLWLGHSAAELVGKLRFQDLLSVGSKIFHQTHWMPLLQVQGSVAEVQLELMHRDGRPVHALVNARKHSGQGEVRHDLAIFIATDRRAYERELLKARKRAEELLESERNAQDALANVLRENERAAKERAVLAEQLVGIVSHDLRTPLSAILLGAHLLEATGPTAAQARTLKRIASAGGRANRLIADLLDFTQAQLGGGLRISRTQFDLHDMVADCTEELKLAWPGRLIEHVREGEGQVSADLDRLAQVVTNLTSNALTYGAPGQPVVLSSCVCEHEMMIRVHNTGEAIPDELMPHLFEPLRRGERQIKLGHRSVGLGLYIVHEIVNAHAGHVTVRSTPLEGTTFSVVIGLPADVAQ